MVPEQQQQQQQRNLLKNLILRCSLLQEWELALFLKSSSRRFLRKLEVENHNPSRGLRMLWMRGAEWQVNFVKSLGKSVKGLCFVFRDVAFRF